MIVRTGAVLIASLVAATASPVAAQEAEQGEAAEEEEERPLSELPGAEDEARMHFHLATRYYETGRFEQAALEYERSYELAHLPELLYNAYLAFREAGRFDDGVRVLEAFIERAEDPVRRRSAEARLASLRRLADQVGAGNSDDDTPAEDSGGGAADLDAEEEPGAESTESSGGGGGGSVAPWILAGGGAALVVVSAVTGALALDANAELDAGCDATGCPASLTDRQDEGQSLQITTDVLWAVGAAAITVGLVWAIVELAGGGDADDSVALTAEGLRWTF